MTTMDPEGPTTDWPGYTCQDDLDCPVELGYYCDKLVVKDDKKIVMGGKNDFGTCYFRKHFADIEK